LNQLDYSRYGKLGNLLNADIIPQKRGRAFGAFPGFQEVAQALRRIAVPGYSGSGGISEQRGL
jgi:hypothetical protein